MPNALIIDVINAVIADINSHDWDQEFTADRRYIPRYAFEAATDSPLPAISNLQVYVRPTKRSSENLTRRSNSYTHSLELGFYKRITKADPATNGGVPFNQAEVDALVKLVEDVEGYLGDAHRLATLTRARCMSATTEPIYDAEALEAHHVFASRMVVEIVEEPVT